MNAEQTLFPFGAKMAAGGGFIWLFLLFGTATGRFSLSIFDLLFLLAVWLVVPLTLSLLPATSSRITRMVCDVILYCLLPGAIFATVGFRLPVGRAAGLATLPWFVVAVFLAVDGLARLIRTRLRSFQEFCFAFGEGYALVGALWLAASRLGLQPVGFREPIVLLTAIHFHYAGLMAAVLAGLAASSMRTPLFLRIALSCAVLGAGLLGLAFLVGPELKLAAVGLMVIGECGIAVGTFRIGLTEAKGIGGRLLLIGSAC